MSTVSFSQDNYNDIKILLSDAKAQEFINTNNYDRLFEYANEKSYLTTNSISVLLYFLMYEMDFDVLSYMTDLPGYIFSSSLFSNIDVLDLPENIAVFEAYCFAEAYAKKIRIASPEFNLVSEKRHLFDNIHSQRVNVSKKLTELTIEGDPFKYTLSNFKLGVPKDTCDVNSDDSSVQSHLVRYTVAAKLTD